MTRNPSVEAMIASAKSGLSSDFPLVSLCLARSVFTTLIAVALVACVYVPTTTSVYDPDCRTASKRIQLEPVQVGVFVGCSGRECGALLVAAGATALASAVVSGSIAVIGNAVYWLEEQGNCQRAASR